MALAQNLADFWLPSVVRRVALFPNLDFLPDGGNSEYETFIATVDAILIGRRTFEKAPTSGSWPYGKMPVLVLSSNPVDVPVVKDGVVEHRSGDRAEIVERLSCTLS